MAFGAPDTKEEADQQYDVTNPASALNARETAALDQMEAGLNDNEKTDDINSASNSLNDREFAAAKNGFYESSKGKSGNKAPLYSKILTKKKAGVFSIIAILVGGGGIMAGFFGPATMLINVMENFQYNNDSASVVKESRMKRVFKNMTAETSTDCVGKKTLKCKTSRISNKALNRLSKNGIVAVDADGKPIKIDKNGYPDKNPSHYSIDGGDPIKSSDLADELLKKGNEKHASKVYGRYGAFKMRARAWTGKNIKNRLLDKFGLKRNGGIVANIDKKLKVSDRIKAIKEKTPKLDSNKALERVNKKMNRFKGKMSKGGATYAIAAAACASVKIPGMIATGVTAIQLAPIVSIVMDTILSPASRAKAAGFGSGFTPEMADTVGTMLTEKGITEGSSNKKGSALDSKYLLSAIGVNKKKSSISQYVPGYSVYKHPLVQGAKKIDGATETFCNATLSPAAMYSSLAVETAMTAISGGMFGILTFVGKQAAKVVAMNIIEPFIEHKLMDILKTIAENDLLPKARYVDLGDAIGIGAAAFFSSGGMAQGLPALKTSQLAEFSQIQLANEEFQKNMDIASLSPFDTSSKYTFLGSIIRNMSDFMIINGTYDNSFSSILSNIAKLPSFALSFSDRAKASSGIFAGDYCMYANDFGQQMDDGDVAINMAGLPCTGITKEQAEMSTEEAIQIAIEEGWIDGDEDIPDGATIDEIHIKEDSPLWEFLDSCSDASTGDYWTNTGGCTVSGSSASGTSRPPNSYNTGQKDEDDQDIIITSETLEVNKQSPETIDNRKMAAMSVFLIDYQISQSINGEDDEEATGAQVATTDDIVKAGEMFFDYTYLWGGHFHGSVDEMKNTINEIKNGSRAKGTMLTDCSGFVRASIYAAKGFDIEASYTGAYSSYVGKTIDEVSKDNLKPGDIAWKPGHVEIVTKVEGGQVYTQGARGPDNGGPIGGPSVMGGWTNYYRAKV